MREIARMTLFLCLLAMAWIATGSGANAQSAPTQLELQGVVLDPQGAAVVESVVEIMGPDAKSRTVLSGAEGQFRFPSLKSGSYRIRVQAPGFEVYEAPLALQGSIRDYRVRLQISRSVQQVTVSATLPDMPGASHVESGRIVEARPTDLAGFLRSQSGLAAFRRGPINLEPTIRGLQEQQIGMFVDGTRTFAAGPARMDSDISHVSPHSVESVEAVKGPYALHWGAGAMSALRIRTFRPSFHRDGFQAHGRVSHNFGANAVRHDGFGNLSVGGERYRFHMFYNRRQGNDYRAGNGERIPGNYAADDVRWSLGFKLSPKTELEYLGGYQEQQEIDYPGRILDATYFLTRSHSWEIRWQPQGEYLSEISGQIYINRKSHLMNNDRKPTARPAPGRIPPFPLRIDLPTSSNTVGGNFRAGFRQGVLNWELGFDFYNLNQNAERFILHRTLGRPLFNDVVWPEATIHDQGIYGRLFHEAEDLQIGVTVRTDWVQASAGETSDFFRRNTTGSLDGNETNFSAALAGRYQMNKVWAFTAGLGRAVRTASVLERYSDRFPATRFQISAEFMGNPTLDPEKSTEFNLGTELSLPAKVNFSVDAFYRRINDYITVSPDPTLRKRLPLSPPVVFRYIQGTSATFYGSDASLTGELGDYVSWGSSLSYIWARDDLLQEPVMGIPPLWALARVRFHSRDQRHWLQFSATAVGRQSRVAVSRFEMPTPGYAVFDARSSFRVAGDLRLNVGIENLGDRFYAHHLNSLNPFHRQRIPEIGRTLYAGLEYEF